MRRAVVEALGKIGTPAVGPLSAALKDKNRAVREAVVEALDRLSWQPDRSEAGAMYWIEKRQWDRCADIGSLAVAPLTRALENKDPEVRWAAARALGQIGDAQAAETLIAALKHEAAAFDKAAFDKATDTDAAFSQGPHLEAAMLAVSRISNIQAVEPLIAALLEEDSHVRLAAALALGSIGALRAVQPLETAHMNSRLRQSKALASLKEIEDLLNREKATVSRRDVAAQVHTLAAIYAVEWKAVELAAEVEDERVVQSSLEQALLEIRVRSIAALKDSENGSLTPSWYMAKSDRKHVRQVVVLIPPEKEVAPQVDNLVPPGALFGFMDAHWAAITLTMSSPDPGPFVFVRAEGVVEQLRHYPVRVAFSFYRMNAGGLFTVFVHVQCPSVEARTGNPAVFENTHDLDKEDARKLVEALIARDTIEICFTASGEKGPCTGYFGMVAPLPEDCRTALKAEWEQLLDYHKSVAVGRSFRERTVQMEQENPIQENPILDK
jgi:HEAT repeat protein